jgi:hypothetical protein
MKKLFLLLLMAITANFASGQTDAKFNPTVYTKPLPRIITVANQPSDFKMTTHLVNIKVPADSAKLWDGAMEKRYIKRLFSLIKDVDCLILNYSGFIMIDAPSGYTLNNGFQYHDNIQNDVANIGLPLFNNAAKYGSDKLHSVTTLSEANALRPEIVVHEFFHQWNSYMEYANYWLMDPSHHTGLVEDNNTVFEGVGHYSDFKYVRDGFFSYKVGSCTGFPGKLQGYLAGLWDMPDELKTLKNYWNDNSVPGIWNGDGTITYQIKADSLVVLNKTRLFNVCGGERFPNYQNSKKHFDGAIVVFSLNDFLSDDKLKGFHYMSMLNELEGTPSEYNSLYDQVCLEGYIYANADFGHRQTNIYHSTFGKLHYCTRLFKDDGTIYAVPNFDGVISGNSSVCSGATNVVYNIPPIKYATSYVWTLPTGVSGTSTTNSITVNYDAAATSGDITVKGRNASGDGNLTVLPIHILDSKSLPAMPDPIIGRKIVCAGQRFLSYTVPEIANASSYVWTLPPRASGSSTTNSITVKYSLYSSSGDITVKGINCNGEGAVRNLPVIVNELPLEFDIIGLTKICKGDTVMYSVSPIDGATSYNWSGSGIVKKISPTSIMVCPDNSLPVGGGFGITLTVISDCGESVSSFIWIRIDSSPTYQLPGSAGLISGTTSVFPGQNSVVYSVPAIENASSYIWTLPEGATGSSTSKNIVVNYSKSAKLGKVTVKGKNFYGEGGASALAIKIIALPENSLPEKAGPITGASIVTPNINHAEYSVESIAGASSYLWTLPEGATGTSKTNSILVNFSIDAEPGEITVKGVNSFGQGISSTMQITVNHSSINKLPDAAGTITGPLNICKGEWVTYTVPLIPNSIMYTWLVAGVFKVTYSNNITFLAPENLSSFWVTVRGNNTLGSGESSLIVINVTSPPTTPLISSTGNVLNSNTSPGIQWYNQNGIINGATSQSYSALSTGDYYAIQTLEGCSSEASNILHVVVSGIGELKKDKAIKVYPNPFTNELIIEIEGNNEKQDFEILNTIGQVVFKGSIIDKTTLRTGNFVPGIYLIKLKNGKYFEFKKIKKG